MEVFLYNSTVCRLCGEENDNGSLLYSSEENNQSLCGIINTYLPLKVSDDGELPRTICPGCTIQLEATVEFLNLISKGQKIIRELYQREKEYKKSLLKNEDEDVITEKIIYEINTSDGVYQVEHPIALQIAGLEKPKRKRGRPPKKPKTPEELAKEAAEKEKQLRTRNAEKDHDDHTGKRRRRTPTRFKEAVQGKELERIFKEEGVIDGEESDNEIKPDIDTDPKQLASKESEVIGHMETSGELVVVVKGKGRGRPKGRMRPTREQCAICGMQFSCVGRYMSHVARHGRVRYRCGCGRHFDTRLLFTDHQRDSGHTGQTVVPAGEREGPVSSVKSEPVASNKTSTSEPPRGDNMEQNASLQEALPDLGERTDIKTAEEINESTEDTSTEVSPSPLLNDSRKKNEDVDIDNAEIERTEEPQPVGKPRLKCNLCDKTFSNRQSKSLHMKARHAGERPYACGECGATFAYPRSRALHALSHRRTSAADGFACDLCGKVLNHPSSVVYHKQAQHAQQRFVCAACGKRFRHRQLLRRHQLVHSQARPYGCKTCNASFKTKANLLNHQLLHSGVKRFSCEICKHKFAHKTSLTLHMRWHTGVKPFSCKTCGKSFSQKGNLSEHERIHSGEKPYQCGVCVRRFTTSSQHRLHARRHLHLHPHRKNTYEASETVMVGDGEIESGLEAEAELRCEVCERVFMDRGALVRHSRRHGRPADHRKQAQRQISLLVNDRGEPREHQVFAGEGEVEGEAEAEGDNERVIYVAYDVGDPEASHLHILDTEQAANLGDSKVLTTCELYSGSSLLMKPELEQETSELIQFEHETLKHETLEHETIEHETLVHETLEHETLVHETLVHETLEHETLVHETLELEHEQLEEMQRLSPLVINTQEHIPVTDEQGNPLHFTMQDGTRLAITSADGRSLQVITQDGQTIPVEINGFAEEEEVQNTSTIVHQLNLRKSVDDNSSPVTHYFTIV